MLYSRQDEYVKIDSKKFFEGMFVSADLYCRYRNNYVLVFKSALLTKKLIDKIKQLEFAYGNLYVEKKYHQRILDQFAQYEAILKKLEFDTNYTSIKEKTSNILNVVDKQNVVPKEATNIATKIIADKISGVDAAIIFQLINNVRDADEYLYTHSTNVAFLNGLIAKWLELPDGEISSLIAAGLLHDIGKLKVPPEILNKPAKLTKQEFEVIKLHPIYSYEILRNSGEINPVILSAARNHHEKISGSGYPDGLKYDQISRAARITAISDIYDAMITRRVYKDPHSPFEVLEEFSKGSFTDLDLDIVKVFLTKMPFELIGKSVLLSDGSIGKVVYIDPDDFAYPLVQIGPKVVQTNKTIKCVCMCNAEV
ncbi:MAG: HD-GYP domain-containing protein [Clostridia bacterium]|nr:HD-GYP domain-containing protein [Clostridia bacterium]